MTEREQNKETKQNIKMKHENILDLSEDQIDEYNNYEANDTQDPILLSEYEHKAYLINSSLNKKIEKPSDFLSKELSLSRIDNDTAFLYGMKLDCIEEWMNLGFKDLAMRRFAKLIGRLQLNKSIGGLERILQTANTQAGIDLTENGARITNPFLDEETNNQDMINGIRKVKAMLENRKRKKIQDYV